MKAKQKTGRRSKLTPERRKQIVSAVAAGVPVKYASAKAGVTDATVWRWIQRGRAEERGIYAEFAAAMEQAQAESISALVAQVTVAAQKDWRAASWLLTRRAPDQFMDPGKRAELAAAEARAEVARAEADRRVAYIGARARLLEVDHEWEAEQE
jgi:hypothetical protein